MSFGSNLENLRKQKGWSQDKLADKLHISRQAISKWENGTSKPDIDNVKSISNIFSIGIDELLDNELPDRAAKLDVEKEEKKENVIQVIKYMIIAVVLIYLISVIGKFISLLTIVNGIQKYANLDNYHYVITTYEDNEIKQDIECWFKDGISKTITTNYTNELNNIEYNIIYIDYNNLQGYIENKENKMELDVQLYIQTHIKYNQGYQLYSELPTELRKDNLTFSLMRIINSSIKIYDENIVINFLNSFIKLEKNSLLPDFYYLDETEDQKCVMKLFSIDIGTVTEIDA